MGQCALVTGGSSGIGAAIVATLAAHGFVVLAAGRDRGRLDAQVELAASRGGHVRPVVFDATDRSSVQAALEGVGEIDALINCAGSYTEGPFLEATETALVEMMSANVSSVLIVSQEVVPLMKAGGRIINIASRAFLGAPSQSLYAASKAAVITLTRCMAVDLAPRGILVNAISPGLIETPMTEALGEQRLAAIRRVIPGGRIGSPDDVAAMVAVLAGRGGAYVNGANIIIDAGRSIGAGFGS